MASQKWVRPSQATIDYFERLAPGAPLETRKMFGMPSRFLHGYMLVGLFANTLILHLSPVDRVACIKDGAQRFKPMGREMEGYVAIKPGTFTDHDLKWWIVRGMRHLATLPPRHLEEGTETTGSATNGARAKRAKAKGGAKATVKVQAKRKSTQKLARRPAAKKVARRAAPKPAKQAAARKKARPRAKKGRTRR